MNRNASAVWKGSLHEGEGTLTTESGVLSETQYSYRNSFVDGIGTNPDELIAASLGGCFSMALSNELGLAGFHPQRIETTATATLEDLGRGLDGHARCNSTSMQMFRTPLKRVLWMRRSRQKQTVLWPACLKQISR
jgi:OsmC subfamily peroxiredoxin